MALRLYIAEESEKMIKHIMRAEEQDISEFCASICCVSMLVERSLDLSFPPDLCTHFAARCGVTVDHSDNFLILAGAVSGRFSLQLSICKENDAIAKVRNGAKAIVRFESPESGITKTYLFDHYYRNTFYMINPSIQQGKGLPRSKKRLIQIKDEYALIPQESYHIFYPEDSTYFVFSA